MIRLLRNMFRYLRRTISIKSRLVLIGLATFPVSATRKQSPTYAFDLARPYPASRISSNLKGSTKQFGRLQAPATTPSSAIDSVPSSHASAPRQI